MKFVIPAPKQAATATASPAAKAAPVAAPPAKATTAASDDGFDFGDDLPDLGNDFGDLLDDALNEPSPAAADVDDNPFAAPLATSEPAPAPGGGGGSRAQRTKLANGIKLVFWGTTLGVLSVIVAIVGGIVLPVLALVAVGVALVGGLLCTAGRIVCLAGPSSFGGKGLVIAAVACDLIYLTINVLVAVGAIDERLEGIGSLFSMATWILFVLFLKKVATSIGQAHLADEARTIIVLTVISIVLLIASPLLVLVFPVLPLFTVLGFLGTAIAAFVKYVNLLQHTAEEVRPR